MKILKIPEYSETNPLAEEIANPILKSVLKYDKLPNVTAIRNLNIKSHFEFSFASVAEVLKEIKNFSPHKAAQSTDIPIKILKDKAGIFADYICRFFNESLNCCKFPSILKHPNVTPVFKKGYRCSKENYRPVSMLPVMSKICLSNESLEFTFTLSSFSQLVLSIRDSPICICAGSFVLRIK